eukprot:15110-Rhodomonas_salina.1
MYTLTTLLQAYLAGVEDLHTPQSSTGQNAQPFGQHAPRDKGKPERRCPRKDSQGRMICPACEIHHPNGLKECPNHDHKKGIWHWTEPDSTE